MSNKEIKNSEFETTLRNKMDELASSVDCFDKICSRAFPENSEEYSDCEYTVCDVENVTGKKTFFRFFPVLAVAAGLMICLFFLPQSGNFLNKVFSNVGNKQSEQDFRALIAEINEETANGNYSHFDCTLEQFIKNDILISPLYGCPFEEKDSDDIKVRVFVRMYGDIPTNQVYAVEYEGSYSDANYIAAADSRAKITDDELDALTELYFGEVTKENAAQLDSGKIIPDIRNRTFEFIGKKFNGLETGQLINDKGTIVNAASFTYNCLYKHDDLIYPLANEIIYYHENSENLSGYSYDIYSVYNDSGSLAVFDNSGFEDAWNNVVYYNGSSAAAEKELSDFKRSNDFSGYVFESDFNYGIAFIEPFSYVSTVFDKSKISHLDKEGIHFNLTFLGKNENEVISNVLIPFNTELRDNLRIYFSGGGSGICIRSSEDRIFYTVDYYELIESVNPEYNAEENRELLNEIRLEQQKKIENEKNSQLQQEAQNQIIKQEKEMLNMEIDKVRADLANAQSLWEAARAGNDYELMNVYSAKIAQYSKKLDSLLAQTDKIQ